MHATAGPDVLKRHLPAAAWPVIVQFLRRHPLQVRISKPRITKLGDFRSATRSQPHRVSVNGDLNKYAFLVTLVHEFAHYTTHVRTRRWTPPHGAVWKSEYHRLMRPFMSRAVMPADVLAALEAHLRDPAASSCTDHELMRVLRKYDRDPRPMLEEIPERAVFRFNDRIFVKGPQLRKRYKCHCLNDRRVYLIDPLAEVHVNGPLIVRKAG
jgi:predicted SprT family Zn-dependent metalloprotease